jgi:hypothetical protein
MELRPGDAMNAATEFEVIDRLDDQADRPIAVIRTYTGAIALIDVPTDRTDYVLPGTHWRPRARELAP